MERSAAEVVTLYISEMWGHRRPELVDELVDPDYRADGRAAGREFVRRNITRIHTAFPDLAIEIIDLIADGDRVAALFEYKGTHRGMFGGIEPTGRPIRFRESGFFHVRNGMVTEADYVADGLGARIQLGVLPETFWTDPRW